MKLRFDRFELDTDTAQLSSQGTPVPLEPQPAALLVLLASRPGELVTHAEIRQRLWGDVTHVNFQEGLHYCARQVRLALGDSARQPRFVQTVPRRGYRFLPPVPAVSPARRSLRPAWVVAGLVALLAVTAVIEQRPNNHHQVAVALLTRAHDLVFR